MYDVMKTTHKPMLLIKPKVFVVVLGNDMLSGVEIINAHEMQKTLSTYTRAAKTRAGHVQGAKG